jgi:Tfp pilus assembly protein PilN
MIRRGKDLVKIIPKPKPKTPFFVNLIFWLSIILLIGSIALLLSFESKVSKLENQKEALEKELGSAQTEVKTLEKELREVALKIEDFSKILKEHKHLSEFFNLLKKSTHRKVQFTGLELDTRTLSADLTGKTENFQTLGEQLLILNNREEIKNLEVSNITLSREGTVEFELSFNFSDKLIKKQKDE